MLKIENLEVKSNNKNILNGIDLFVEDNSIHILMGPNGAGKSSICKTLMNHPLYQKTNGKIFYKDKDITNYETSDIANLGIYYINQTPMEIEGITNAEMIRTSLLDRGEKIDIFAFQKKCYEICTKLNLPKSFLHRGINEGMSGGERKKNELFGMWMLEPELVILDEIDSGLDVDSLKIVSKNLKEYQKEKKATLLIVTHQPKLIEELNPDYVHIIYDGKIVESGNISLAKDILKNGFQKFSEANRVSDENETE